MTSAWSGWHRCVLLVAIAVGAYFQTWVDLFPYWTEKNATYTHGSLIAATCFWLIWQRRHRLGAIPGIAEPAALPFVLALSALWLLSAAAHIFVVHVALWPILAFAIVWGGAGRNAAAVMAFPLGFLYFGIPVWELFKPPLQALASAAVGSITSMLGISAAVDGPYIILPTQTVYIALDCSGAHFLAVALAVGVLAGELRNDTIRTRALIIGIAGLLSILFNWLRITLIVFAYYHENLRQALETMGHLTFGWWVFGLDLIVFAIVLRFVPSIDAPSGEVIAGSPPETRTLHDRRSFLLTLVAASFLPALAWALPKLDEYPSGEDIPELSLGDEYSESIPDLLWKPEYPGAAWEQRAAFVSSNDNQIEVYANSYHEQAERAQLVSRGARLFDATSFIVRRRETRRLSHRIDRVTRIVEVELEDTAGRSWIALYSYIVNDDPIASSWRVQIATALRSLYSRPTAGIVAVATRCQSNCGSARMDLEDVFVAELGEYVETLRLDSEVLSQ